MHGWALGLSCESPRREGGPGQGVRRRGRFSGRGVLRRGGPAAAFRRSGVLAFFPKWTPPVFLAQAWSYHSKNSANGGYTSPFAMLTTTAPANDNLWNCGTRTQKRTHRRHHSTRTAHWQRVCSNSLFGALSRRSLVDGSHLCFVFLAVWTCNHLSFGCGVPSPSGWAALSLILGKNVNLSPPVDHSS